MDKNTMHIVYCGDAAYVPAIGVSMTSVIWSNIGRVISFHLLLDNVTKSDMERLQAFGNMYRSVAGLQIYRVRPDRPELALFKQANSTYTPAASYRLLAASLLPAEVDRVLYLDGDVICRSPLDALWQTELGENLAAGVNDPLQAMHQQRTGITDYVNSGVLLIDLAAWRQENVTGQILDCFRQHAAELRYPDQDAINRVCRGRILHLPQKFNYPVSCNFAAAGLPNQLSADAVLCHFVGPVAKPWFITCLDPRAALWQQNCDRSFWPDFVLSGTEAMRDEMTAVRRLFEDGEEQAAFRRYRALIRKVDGRFEPVVLRQPGWKIPQPDDASSSSGGEA